MLRSLGFFFFSTCVAFGGATLVACSGDDGGGAPEDDSGVGSTVDAGTDAKIDGASDSSLSEAGADSAPRDAMADATDSAMDGDAQPDDANDDAPSDARGDAPSDAGDGSAPVTPVALAVGDLAVCGITADGWLIYTDDASHAVYAVSLAGGAPLAISGASSSAQGVRVVDKVVFVDDNQNAVGRLVVWSSASGVHTIPNADKSYSAIPSVDGTRLLYVVDGATSGTFVFMEASLDLTGAVTLVTSSANPKFGVAGDRFVIDSSSAVDGGTAWSIESFSNAGVATHLFDGSWNFVSGRATDAVFAFTSTYGVVERTAAGGPVISLATNAWPATFSVTPDESRAVWENEGSNIDSSYVTSPTASSAPVELPMTSGGDMVSDAALFSPDGLHFAVVDASDYYVPLVSTLAGNQQSIEPVDDGGVSFLWTDGFTTDSRFLVVSVNPSNSVFFEELLLVSVDGFAQSTVMGTGISNVKMMTGSKISYQTQTALWAVDATTPGSPTMIATTPYQSVYALNPTRDGAVYSGTGASGAGLYYVALP